MIESLNEAEIATQVRKMSDEQLHNSAIQLAEKERRLTLVVLRHLNEIDRRRLYSKFRAPSLHAYCVNVLKYDDGGAGRRVSAARLLRELPELEEKILSGSVTMTSVAQAGIFFRREERSGHEFSVQSKRELTLELESKSTREVDRILISKSGQPEIHFRERIVPKSAEKTEVTIYLDHEALAALERLKEIWSHSNPHATLADVVKRATSEAVEKHDPLKRIERTEARASAKKLNTEN